MRKYLLGGIIFIFCNAEAQVVSIRPDSAFQGESLTTFITVSTGAISYASPPMSYLDIFLQQGATVIYCDPSFNTNTNVYFCWWNYCDSLYADFNIPVSAPLGLYDVHVISYLYDPFNGSFNPVDNFLNAGFFIANFTGVSQNEMSHDIVIYQDRDKVFLKMNDAANRNYTWSIYDVTGREFFTRWIGDGKSETDASALPDGILLATVKDGNGNRVHSQRLILVK